ncbi:MAG: hypothetical protein JO257_07330 [Deltaproteobacteria bacterium]|nr:hypothetical protein [Deltaproteobacteria bacterium]
MPKPPAQSDFTYESPNLDHEKDMADNGADTRVAKVVYVVIAVLFVVLFLLVGIGLHIPSGG